MNRTSTAEIDSWEDEGGSAPVLSGGVAPEMTGTKSQVEWATRIRLQVNAEFDRVAASFRSIAVKQGDAKRAETESIIAILEDQRSEVISRTEAGYFIRDWQEISDQVRQMIFQDPRYQRIKSERAIQETNSK